MNLQAIKEAALQLKDKLTKPPLTDILIEATSNENWNTPTKLLQEISEASFIFTQCDTIMKFIWKRLDSDNREWRRILKTLNLIEYLTKNGAPRCVGEFRDSIFKIRSFSDFILIEQGSDKGLSIRDKSKQLVDLLCDEKQIEEERENAKRIRERLAGNNINQILAAGGIGAIGSNTNYQGYGRDTYKNDSYKGYGNESNKNEATRNNTNGQNTTTKSDQQTYQSKYGIWDDGGLEKYKKAETKNNNNSDAIQWDVPKPEVIQPTFQETIQKLAKQNEKWDVPAPKQTQQQPQQVQQAKQQNTQPQQQQTQKQNVIDIFDFEPQQNQQPQVQHIQPLQPPPSQKSNNNDWGSFDNVKPQTSTQQQTQSQVLLPLDTFNQQVQQQQIQQQQQQQQMQRQQNNFFGQELQQNQQQQLYQQQQFSQPQQYHQQQHQNQQTNLNLYQQNYQQSLQVNYNQQQYNSMNHQQQQLQVNQQQSTYNQQKVQQTKQDDLAFGDFISAQQQKQPISNQADLLGMLDLKKEKEELESKKQIPIGNQQIQQNQIYPDIDTFAYNYPKKQQTFSNYQYPQGR